MDMQRPMIFNMLILDEQLDGDLELCREIIDLYLEDTPNQLQALDQGLQAHDAFVVERKAHTIKGASASVGAEAMQAAAYEMEKAGRDQDLNLARRLWPDLNDIYEKTQTFLSRPVTDLFS